MTFFYQRRVGFTHEILLIIDKLQKLDSGSLQTPLEWKNRTHLDEHYTFNLAIPLEDII